MNPLEVWLFGSRAENRARATSDYDLLVVMPDGTPEADLDPVRAWRLGWDVRVTADIIPCTRSEFDEEKNEIDSLPRVARLIRQQTRYVATSHRFEIARAAWVARRGVVDECGRSHPTRSRVVGRVGRAPSSGASPRWSQRPCAELEVLAAKPPRPRPHGRNRARIGVLAASAREFTVRVWPHPCLCDRHALEVIGTARDHVGLRERRHPGDVRRRDRSSRGATLGGRPQASEELRLRARNPATEHL